MQLRYSPTSPYVRKVSVTIIEKGLAARVENVPTVVWTTDAEVRTLNPLGKVPVLIDDEGLVLFDSPVICEYLDSLSDAPRLIPASGAARWRALRRQALADGILDAAIACLMEGKRPQPQRSADWLALQRASIDCALGSLEGEAPAFSDSPDIAAISVACALGYLDFRFADIGWRAGRDTLAEWYERFAERPSLRQTIPADPA